MPPARESKSQDRIVPVAPMTTRLLLLSNGHGEDLIAMRLIKALQEQASCHGENLRISVLPLVGEGNGFAALQNVELLGPRQHLPSGGFSNQSLWALLKDLWAGVGFLSLAQIKSIRRGCRPGEGAVLAVVRGQWCGGGNRGGGGGSSGQWCRRHWIPVAGSRPVCVHGDAPGSGFGVGPISRRARYT